MIFVKNLVPILSVIALSCTSTITSANDSEIQQLPHRVNLLEKQKTLDTPLNIRLYATFRPSITHSKNEISSTDITDFLSHAGFSLNHDLGNDWQAIAQGEWSIDMANNGDFGKARRAYVGIESPYGRVAIGKQRPVQYLLIAEYVDIFNHANAPFAYDNFSPFFVDNLVSYKKQWQRVSLLSSIQLNGEQGDNSDDMFNLGLSYDHNNLHIAATYLTKNMPLEAQLNIVGDKGTTYAFSAAKEFDNSFYIAAAWQHRTLKSFSHVESSQKTLDVSLAYQLSQKNKIKAGIFVLDDDSPRLSNRSYEGANLTLEHKLSANFQFHVELLHKRLSYVNNNTALSIGFKYNFSKIWR
ncbi:MAG: porin [Psychrobium sp.]|nr:porin [Psychrobium sp.]